ncbi:hypothetical protein PUN28_006839 [Cardiocondyla obscurior]|uniref:Uncharacterized protein n=1 Tax=Cardiocondyla obscurior TaxID=286306 RepID=A0AAW2G326_9HYME
MKENCTQDFRDKITREKKIQREKREGKKKQGKHPSNTITSRLILHDENSASKKLTPRKKRERGQGDPGEIEKVERKRYQREVSSQVTLAKSARQNPERVKLNSLEIFISRRRKREGTLFLP